MTIDIKDSEYKDFVKTRRGEFESIQSALRTQIFGSFEHPSTWRYKELNEAVRKEIKERIEKYRLFSDFNSKHHTT